MPGGALLFLSISVVGPNLQGKRDAVASVAVKQEHWLIAEQTVATVETPAETALKPEPWLVAAKAETPAPCRVLVAVHA